MLSCCVIWHLFSVYLPTPLCLHTRGFWPLTTSSLCLAAIILNLKCKKRILWQPNSFHTFCPDSQMSSEQQRRWKKNAFPRTSETRQTGFVSIQQARILCWKLKALYYIHAIAEYRKSYISFLPILWTILSPHWGSGMSSTPSCPDMIPPSTDKNHFKRLLQS